jgi:hypothetical protein
MRMETRRSNLPRCDFLREMTSKMIGAANMISNGRSQRSINPRALLGPDLTVSAGYRRATWLQAPLAIVSFRSGVVAYLFGAGRGWLLAAVLVGAVVPFTLTVIMPTNHKLLEPGRDLNFPETRRLLGRWGNLHAVRRQTGWENSCVPRKLPISRRFGKRVGTFSWLIGTIPAAARQE